MSAPSRQGNVRFKVSNLSSATYYVPMVLATGQREKDLVKEAFNERVAALKTNFEAQVSAIALEFSRRGHHYSQRQIRTQVIYKLSKPKKMRKPMIPNAWAHAEAQAQRLKDGRLAQLPYKKEYVQILEDINEKRITYQDVQNPVTSTEEYNAQVILDGVMVKRQNRALKETIISPELSMNSIATHARDELINIGKMAHQSCGVEILIMMTRGHRDDLFTPVFWATDKAKSYWGALKNIDMEWHLRVMEAHAIGMLEPMAQTFKTKAVTLRREVAEATRLGLRKITEKPRLSMEWRPENYLRLMTKHRVAIDMSSYPGGTLVEPKNANVDHLRQVLDGWNKGDIKWVTLTSDQVEKKCEELASLTSNKANNADVTATQERMPQAESSIARECRNGEGEVGMSENAAVASVASATTPTPPQPNATQFSAVTNDQVKTTR
ncbi:uncharacterized protein EI90DRAFT_3133908 [Cantharellus anzutake]|uniref:uncharacterized protein n=1 Tax=Cantharellus anzutake TaxID=1750568 RepID=UPI001907E1E2|nr:uncharacterized protein EI90DRAFT_3133908 [Cantharellus anzutake]KAF8317284.1 hypothetical protein EI90DRAFT_3133908 [Cantharellus anzutake]